MQIHIEKLRRNRPGGGKLATSRWMVVIWAVSVVGLGVIAALLRGLMGLSGLASQRIDAFSPQILSSMSRPLALSRSPHRKEVSHYWRGSLKGFVYAGIPIGFVEILGHQIDEATHLCRKVLPVGIERSDRDLIRQEFGEEGNKNPGSQFVSDKVRRDVNQSLPKYGGRPQNVAVVGFEAARYSHRDRAIRPREVPLLAPWHIIKVKTAMRDEIRRMLRPSTLGEIFRRATHNEPDLGEATHDQA